MHHQSSTYTTKSSMQSTSPTFIFSTSRILTTSDKAEQGRLCPYLLLYLRQLPVDSVIALPIQPQIRQPELGIVLWPPSRQGLSIRRGSVEAVARAYKVQILAQAQVSVGALYVGLEEADGLESVHAVDWEFLEEGHVFFGFDIGVESAEGVGSWESTVSALDGVAHGGAVAAGGDCGHEVFG